MPFQHLAESPEAESEVAAAAGVDERAESEQQQEIPVKPVTPEVPLDEPDVNAGGEISEQTSEPEGVVSEPGGVTPDPPGSGEGGDREKEEDSGDEEYATPTEEGGVSSEGEGGVVDYKRGRGGDSEEEEGSLSEEGWGKSEDEEGGVSEEKEGGVSDKEEGGGSEEGVSAGEEEQGDSEEKVSSYWSAHI